MSETCDHLWDRWGYPFQSYDIVTERHVCVKCGTTRSQNYLAAEWESDEAVDRRRENRAAVAAWLAESAEGKIAP